MQFLASQLLLIKINDFSDYKVDSCLAIMDFFSDILAGNLPANSNQGNRREDHDVLEASLKLIQLFIHKVEADLDPGVEFNFKLEV